MDVVLNKKKRAMFRPPLVPKAGIEPAHPKIHDFESCASTSSATLASVQSLSEAGLRACPEKRIDLGLPAPPCYCAFAETASAKRGRQAGTLAFSGVQICPNFVARQKTDFQISLLLLEQNIYRAIISHTEQLRGVAFIYSDLKQPLTVEK
jgi:hypothetical protein